MNALNAEHSSSCSDAGSYSDGSVSKETAVKGASAALPLEPGFHSIRRVTEDCEFFDSQEHKASDMEVSDNREDISHTSLRPDKKKRHKFRMFHRRHAKKSNKESAVLAETFPLYGNRLSLDNRGPHSDWRSEESLDRLSSDLRAGRSLHSDSDASSQHSLLPVDTDTPKLSDDELIETLVNPPQSWPPPAQQLQRPAKLEGMEYMVNVTLVSGHNLAIRDRTGSSDPYVKFKCPPFKYRSAVVHRNLNPEWNEHFSFKISNLKSRLIVRVYDHDYGALDDFMGGQMLDLSPYSTNERHVIDLGLVDQAAPKDETLGHIRLYLRISPESTDKESTEQLSRKSSINSRVVRSYKVWSNVLTVTLLEGRDLPALDRNGFSDPYCKFKLGTQKFKSKVLSKTLNPKWLECFTLRMLDSFSMLHIEMWDSDFPHNDDFIGSCSVDLSTLARGVTHDFTLPLTGGVLLDADGTIHFKLSISATRVEEEQADFQLEEVHSTYGYSQSFNLDAIRERNIGHLNLKINRLLDVAPCNCYVVVELGNSCVQTQTVGKTASPTWDQAFNFVVQDIHEELEMRVYKVGRNDQLLGKVCIPVHGLPGGSHSYMLKDKHCVCQTRGILCVETEFVYQPVRAMIRTTQPKETNSLGTDLKFQRKVLMSNIKRVKVLVNSVIAAMELVQSAFSWENKVLSAISFLLFMLVTLFGELWMALLGLVILFAYQYTAIFIRNGHVWQNKSSSQVHMVTNIKRTSSLDDIDGSDLSDLEDDKQTSIKEKYRLFQSILVIVQNVLGEVADVVEGIKNLLTWKVPFLSWMAMVVLLIAAVVVYFIPVRYIILAWGVKKFTQKLIRPTHIDNNELLDFLSRCPSNRKLEEWRELPLVVHQKQTLVDIKAGRITSKDSNKNSKKLK